MTFMSEAGFSRKGRVNMDVLKNAFIGPADGWLALGFAACINGAIMVSWQLQHNDGTVSYIM